MNAGKLRHYIDLQSPTVSVGTMGGTSIAFAHNSYAWARVEPQAGGEATTAGMTEARNTVLVTMRYHATVRPTWRIVLGSKTYEVNSIVNVDERNREMRLSCTEVPTI